MRIKEAKTHDKNFLKDIQELKYSMLVFDKAYNYYKQFAKWSQDEVYFATRQKANAVYEVIKKVSSAHAKSGIAQALGEELIEISYKMGKEKQVLAMRRICYQDEMNRVYVFLSNNMTISAEEIALI